MTATATAEDLMISPPKTDSVKQIRNVQPPLTAHDRCLAKFNSKDPNVSDRCGAAAMVRVVFPGDFDLVFCGHHAKAQKEALIAQSAAFFDATGRRTEG